MADFTVRLTAGVVLTVWDDHPAARGSRLNPQVTHPSRYWKATVDSPVTMKATVAGVEGPMDGALGGRLFTSDFGMAASPVGATGAGGQSSVQTFTPRQAGHYLWVMRRAGGGVVAIHLDAE